MEHYKEAPVDKWKIIDHTDDHVLIEFPDGSRLNYDVSALVNRQIPQHLPTMAEMYEDRLNAIGLTVAGVAYKFLANGVLPPHKHDSTNIHTIECTKGHVLVKREKQGDIEITAGQTAEIELDEMHSIHALEPSRTVHWLKTQSD